MRLKHQAILRCQCFFCTYDLINVYKSQVLSYIEYRTPGIYHACNSHLDRLDATQTRFLKELGVSETEALMNFGLAPLRLRRDIAMLGVIHRSVLGKGPPQFQELFQRADASAPTRATRQSAQRHNKQLVDVRDGRFLEVLRRSAFGLIAIYNMLPQTIVDEETVCGFQRCLQELAKQEVAAGNDAWSNLFSPRIALYRHPLRALLSVQ